MHLFARVSVLAVALVALGACGGGDSDTTDGDEDLGLQPGLSATISADERYPAMWDAFVTCLEDKGYSDIDGPEGTLLPDGTRFRPVVGSGWETSGQILFFLAAREECQDEVGLTNLLHSYGVDSTGVRERDPEEIEAMNAFHLERYNCVTARGWNVPPPVYLRGAFHFAPFASTDEEYSAFQADLEECATWNPVGQE